MARMSLRVKVSRTENERFILVDAVCYDHLRCSEPCRPESAAEAFGIFAEPPLKRGVLPVVQLTSSNAAAGKRATSTESPSGGAVGRNTNQASRLRFARTPDSSDPRRRAN